MGVESELVVLKGGFCQASLEANVTVPSISERNADRRVYRLLDDVTM